MDDVRQFIVSCSILLGKLMAVAIPPESKINQMIQTNFNVSYDIIKQEAMAEPNNNYELFSKTQIEVIREYMSLKTLQGLVQLPFRMITLIELNGASKDHQTEITNFLHAASSLRCHHFNLKPIVKYKLEKLIYDFPTALDSVSSMGAAIALTELAKLVTVFLKSSRHRNLKKLRYHTSFQHVARSDMLNCKYYINSRLT